MSHAFIKRGKAVFTANGLRCQGARVRDPDRPCNKLLMRKNGAGQLAGEMKCERCGQIVEVELAATK